MAAAGTPYIFKIVQVSSAQTYSAESRSQSESSIASSPHPKKQRTEDKFAKAQVQCGAHVFTVKFKDHHADAVQGLENATVVAVNMGIFATGDGYSLTAFSTSAVRVVTAQKTVISLAKLGMVPFCEGLFKIKGQI